MMCHIANARYQTSPASVYISQDGFLFGHLVGPVTPTVTAFVHWVRSINSEKKKIIITCSAPYYTRVVIFPGKYCISQDSGKYRELPGNTGKYEFCSFYKYT